MNATLPRLASVASRFSLPRLSVSRSIARPAIVSSFVVPKFGLQSRFQSSAPLGKQPILPPIEYDQANARVKAIYDDMISTFELKGPHQINTFWKVFANHVDAMENLWGRMKVVMAEGELPAAVKEMIYVAVSITNGCDYCIASHTASAKKMGMSDGQFAELMQVTTMANETNRLAFAYRVGVDQMYEKLYAKENAKRSGQ